MYFRLILTACAPCTHAQICGTHAGRNALASAPASSPRAGARAAPRTHVSQSEAPWSRTRATTRRARKSRPRYSGRYAHTRNAMRSAPKDARSLRCFMFAESIPYIFQMFGTMGNLCNTKSICALCNTTSICAVFLCAIIVRAQPLAKKSVTVQLLVVFRRREVGKGR